MQKPTMSTSTSSAAGLSPWMAASIALAAGRAPGTTPRATIQLLGFGSSSSVKLNMAMSLDSGVYKIKLSCKELHESENDGGPLRLLACIHAFFTLLSLTQGNQAS